MGQVPPKYFLPSSPYGASPAASALNPSQQAASNPQTPLLPPSFQDPGTMPTNALPSQALQGSLPSSGGAVNPYRQRNQMFGRGLFGAIALLFLSSLASATTTVTGNIKNLGTTSPSSGLYVRFWLRGCQGAQPRVNGTALIAPSQGGVFFQDFVADANGNISGSVYSTRNTAGTGNGEIECPTGVFTASWYGVQLFAAGRGGPETPVHAKIGATLNVTNATPLTSNPVVIAPTGDTTYIRLDGGNSPVTGALQFQGNNTHTGAETFSGQLTATAPCSIAQILYVETGGCYATIDQAVAAVPSFTIVASPNGCTESVNTVTCTTTAPHGYSVNQVVFVQGVGVNAYNGQWPLTAVTPTTFSYLNCQAPSTLVNCTTGLGNSGGGTTATIAHIQISPTYAGAEAATCSSLDSAGNNIGYTFSLTPANIHVEDRRGTSKCAYNTSWNTTQLQSNPNDLALWRRDVSPVLTSSNITTDMQVTGAIPSAQGIAGGTFEVDTVGNTSTAGAPIVQASNGQWAVRSVGGTITQIMGAAGGGGTDRAYSTTGVVQASGVYAFDPKNNTASLTPATIANSPTGATESGTTVTITTTAACSFTTGEGVLIAGVGVSGYNGSWVVLAPGCNGGSTFTYSNINNVGLAASGSGTVNGYGANTQESYGLIASQPTTGTRNNDAIFAQGPIAFADNIGGIDVMNQSYSLPTGATAQKLLRFGGDNNQTTGGVNLYNLYSQGTLFHFIQTSGTHFNWLIATQANLSECMETTPSTATGGTTFTTPLWQVCNSPIALKAAAPLSPTVAGAQDLGTTALPWGNLWLGTAATNNFKFAPAATAAARIINIPDPLGTTSLPLTIASGTKALNTASITTATCDAGVAATATGTLSTDAVDWSFNAAPTATNKYGAFLVVYAVPSANTVTFYTCNPSATTSTPTAMTVNWSVRRP